MSGASLDPVRDHVGGAIRARLEIQAIATLRKRQVAGLQHRVIMRPDRVGRSGCNGVNLVGNHHHLLFDSRIALQVLMGPEDLDPEGRIRQILEVSSELVVRLDLDGRLCSQITQANTDDIVLPENQIALPDRLSVDDDAAENRGRIRVLARAFACRIKSFVNDETKLYLLAAIRTLDENTTAVRTGRTRSGLEYCRQRWSAAGPIRGWGIR